MAIASARKGFARNIFEYIEIDFEKCANTYGVSPCTAVVSSYLTDPSFAAALAGDETIDFGTGPITSTRSSTAYYFDASGVLQSAATDELRFETDPSDSVVRALIEESRTNLFTANHRLASDWTLAAGTGTKTDTGTGIDNAANSCVVLSDTDNTVASYFRINGTITADTSTSAFLFYVAKNQTYIPLILFCFQNDAVGYAYLDTATGDLSTDSTAGITVKERGNFWELRFAGANINSRAGIRFFFYPCYRATVNGANDATLTGSCTVDWPQGEYNVPWSTSPIDGAGTRADDVDSVPNAEIPTLSSGAVLGATASVPNDGAARTILAAISGTGDTYIQRATSGVIEGKLGGVSFTTTTTPDTGPHKYKLWTDGTNHKVLVDDVVVHTFTGALTQPTGNLYIGSKNGSSDHLNGLIGSLIIWDSAVTDYDTVLNPQCYYTKRTCQDWTNYIANSTPNTVRLLPADAVGIPVSFDGYPCLLSVSVKATELAMGEGLSSRERLDFECKDFTQHDRDMDTHWATRASEAVGTWWGRLRARNAYFSGIEVRYYRGYIVGGVIDTANFEVRTYILDRIDPPSNGRVKLIAKDTLMLGEEKSAKAPSVSPGALTANITAVALSLGVTAGTGAQYRLEENLTVHADDFSDAAWTKSNVTVTADAGNDIHGNAVADNISDASGAASGIISQAASDYSVSETYCAAVDIEKDAIGRATRFPVLRLTHAGSTTEDSDIAIDTSSGETDITTSTGATGGAIDHGTHWRLWIAVASNDGSNTSCTAALLPAAGASATWVQGVAATGSVYASRPQVERNTSPGDYIETAAAAVKNGMQVLVGDEIILVDSRVGDTLSWGSTANRGQWNTTAAAQSSGDAVQWCIDLTGLNVVRAIQRLLIFHTNMSPARIPFIDWETERTGKLTPYTIDTGIIAKPEGVLNLIADLSACTLTNVWTDTRYNQVKLKALAPYTFDTEINEDDNFINGSLQIREIPEKRVSSVWVNYSIFDVLNPTKRASYRKAKVEPGNQNYETDQFEEIYCRWFGTSSPATVLAYRLALMLGDTPIEASFELDDKDGALWTGDPIDVVSDALPDFTGAATLTEMMITSAKPVTLGNGSRRILCLAKPNPYTGRYCLIAPNSGVPTYSYASDYQKGRYGFVGYNSGAYFPDGTPPMQIQ